MVCLEKENLQGKREEKKIIVNAIIHSYKNPNLLAVVERLLASTSQSVHISILDQHPMDRTEKFKNLVNVFYEHKFWDHIDGPTWFKEETIFSKKFDAKYTLLLTDDTSLRDGWLEDCTSFINDNPSIFISGKGKREFFNLDDYFIGHNESSSSTFGMSHLTDRLFMFGLTETFTRTGYPRDIKYFGEEEKMSMRLLEKGIATYSAPSDLYEDLGLRTIENLYCPFSKEHNYNTMIDMLSTDIGKEWLSLLKIDEPPIKLFHQINDVGYDPTSLQMNELGGERFIAKTKAIY